MLFSTRRFLTLDSSTIGPSSQSASWARNMKSILVTGCSGLIGAALSRVQLRHGRSVVGLDLRGSPDLRLDVRDIGGAIDELDQVAGVVHLAAVSRVIAGEHDPEHCWSVNVEGTREVLHLASRLPLRPWIIYASSREVYGEHAELPVREDAERRPVNIYGRSKLAAEQLVCQARNSGLRAATLRFSNVYGSINDYADRVVPAFASAAARGGTLQVDNPKGLLDFSHVDDVVEGVLKLIDLLEVPNSTPPPPIHLTTGVATPLEGLAALAVELGKPTTSVAYAKPRTFDVQHFCGDPARAADILGWRPRTDIRTGFTALVDEFRLADSLVHTKDGRGWSNQDRKGGL
jgi:nucleoside-diphosphate-sugar epimerase